MDAVRLRIRGECDKGRVDRFGPLLIAGAIGVVAGTRHTARFGLAARLGLGGQRSPDLGELRGKLLDRPRAHHDGIRVEIVARRRDGERVGARREAW